MKGVSYKVPTTTDEGVVAVVDATAELAATVASTTTMTINDDNYSREEEQQDSEEDDICSSDEDEDDNDATLRRQHELDYETDDEILLQGEPEHTEGSHDHQDEFETSWNEAQMLIKYTLVPPKEVLPRDRLIPVKSHVIVLVDGEWNVAQVLGEVGGKGYRLCMECTREYAYHPLNPDHYGKDNVHPTKWELLTRIV